MTTLHPPHKKLLIRIAILIVIGIAAVLIYRTLSRYSLSEILDALRAMPVARLAAAGGFAAASYLCLTGFDYLGIRYAGKRLPYPKVALASFTSLSIGHNLGIAALSSGAVRYRFYSRWGLDGEDVAKIIIFSGMTVALGLTAIAGVGLLFYPGDAANLLRLDPLAIRGIAIGCLAFPVAYFAASVFVRGTVRIRQWTFQLPDYRIALAQIAVGTVNFAFVAACLHQLLNALSPVGYPRTAALYAIGNGTALLSHVPGGLGVLEATVVYLLPGAASLAAVVAFRCIYFFIPLCFGLPLFIGSEYFIRPDTARSAQSPQ